MPQIAIADYSGSYSGRFKTLLQTHQTLAHFDTKVDGGRARAYRKVDGACVRTHQSHTQAYSLKQAHAMIFHNDGY